MIAVENLTKEFRSPKKQEGFGGSIRSFFSREYTVKKAVDGVSFSIGAGETVGYIGVNGAGKSTTIKMMTGLLVPTSGSCRVLGVEAWKNRQSNAARIGVVFGQRSQLWWDLPVSESFGILRRIYQIPQARFQENLAYFKKLLDLDEFYLTPVRNLSLGQKMRADFAASLLHDPKIVFLDEPTIGLDLLVKERIRAAIREINERTGTTVILTTHDLTDIEEVCRRIIVIDAGKVLFDGTIDALKSRFGGWRGLRFDVVPGKGGVVAEVLPVGEDLRVTEAPGSLEVRFKKDSWQVADLISRVVGAWEVRDIALEEPQMEDIVKAIYRGEVDVQGAG